MNKLIIGNLVHRPLRSIISALAVAIEVVMILSIVGIFYGILNNSRTEQSGTGYDMIVRPSATGALLSSGAASADVRIADVLRKMPHVQVVAPGNVKLNLSSSVDNIVGIDFASYDALRPFVFTAGGPFQHPYDMIVDDLQAAADPKLRVGSTIKLFNHNFTVCGIVEHGKGARKFIPLETMDALDGTPGKAATFFIRTDDAPTSVAKQAIQKEVKKEILATDGLQDWSVQTIQEFLAGLTPERIPGFKIALDVVIGIASIIGFLVIFQSMYTAVMERTREIGVLKSMGAGKLSIVSVVLRETTLLTSVGIALGVLFAYALRNGLHARFPTLSFQLTPAWDINAIIIALCGSILGALYPALKAARKDPIDALSYE
ncbi:FtsX-like permease family protein [Granulicella sp. 5B5]|uniref:ABC transporter permease n=1 Tax=Granulicella sp. 5B5 TaxID=1617967 RepID=UPI0015F5BA1C|nr:ABC transporter permease [Granulicella sp. 5B5]QMV18439.1 FtsX-like permease family protein [Granulicella sp. 5B5]